jgi:uncharacterized protein (DUF427 family)
MKALWNGEVVAKSHETIVLEGNHYFPREGLVDKYFTANGKSTSCPWKGVATYYDVTVKGDRNSGAAWCYSAPKEKAEQIAGKVAFWGGIKVIDG